ncbi:MAG: DsbA family protein [Methanoregula sp.]|jgi:protein-disulfide isomerase|nr:DsbA family protein [Methanoregula sp.]
MPKTKDNFPLKFILLSLASLLLFVILLFAVCPLVFGGNKKNSGAATSDTFYLNKNYSENDPLLTTVPNLDKIITGPIITDIDPILGPQTAAVNITIYTDFTCRYCGETVANALKLQKNFPDKIRLIHKDFPSADKTFKSYQAAIAGRCAQAQGKFWEMSERLYQNYNNLSQTLFTSLAKELKLNGAQFKQCLDAKTTADLINDNIKEANALRISGVPTVYINEQEMMGEISYEELKNNFQFSISVIASETER